MPVIFTDYLKNCIKKTGDEQNYKKYLALYVDFSDRLYEKKKTTGNLLLEELLRENEEKTQATKRKKVKVIRLIAVIATVAMLLLLIFTLQERKMKAKRYAANQRQLARQKRYLSQEESEQEVLKKAMQDAKNEVIDLGKSNDPSFLTRFEEFYPDFTKRCYQKYPDLTTTERIFSAMIFLGFSSKQIAAYTFIEHRSVQTKRSRLRKKMELSPEADLHQYLHSLIA